MKSELNYIGNAVGVVFSAIQTNEVLSIISWVITLIATLTSIAFTIYNWIRKSTKDGKITKEEIDELHGIIDDSTKKIEEVTKHEQD